VSSVGDRLVEPKGVGTSGAMRLEDGARVGVIGGGPAGAFFSHFLLDAAHTLDLDLAVDLYESRDFCACGPGGCNHCGGIVSESLVQILATEGIDLPPGVVKRGLDSYVLHMDVGSVRIDPPRNEKRIAAVFRGSGPRGSTNTGWVGFDNFLCGLAVEKGARLLRQRVTAIDWRGGRPVVRSAPGEERAYDLVVGAAGVNAATVELFERLGFGYERPRTTKTYICELNLGEDVIHRHMGSSMHVFLLDIPRLEFAALIPKAQYLTLCLLGENIDRALVQAFLSAPEVRRCLPPGTGVEDRCCACGPRIAIAAHTRPYADRIVLIGDCGVTRLYKDGIGAAYRTAKAAANAAVYHGVSASDFRDHYWPACRRIARDNALGRLAFSGSKIAQHARPLRRAIHRMVSLEQSTPSRAPLLSASIWDLFTGSAPYADIVRRGCSPAFVARFLASLGAACLPGAGPTPQPREAP
jgi:flavin-dependent dehydrogenase